MKWKFDAAAKISASPVLDECNLYVGTWDDQFLCIDRATGELRWKVAVGNAIISAATLHGGIAYFGSRDGHVYAVKTRDGSILWKQPIRDRRRPLEATANGPWVEGAPTIGAYTCRWGDETEPPMRLFVGAHDRELHAYNPSTGVEECSG